MQIRDFLPSSGDGQSILITPDRSYYKTDLISNNDQSSGATDVKHIAVAFKSIASFLKAVIFADGKFESILLLSPNVSEDVAQDLMKTAQVQQLFADHDKFGTYGTVEDLLALNISELKDDKTTSWLIATSGTTNKPKLVPHTIASLARTARKSDTSSPFVWGQLYDVYRFAGLQVLLQALAGQSTLVVPELEAPLCKKLQLFADSGVNALSATPTLWRKILMIKEADLLNLRSITLGGEIADDAVLGALQAKFPNSKIRHIYASTEAGAGFSVTDGKAGFPASYLQDGFNGIGLKVVDNILFVENKHVSGSYLGEDGDFSDEDNYVDTGDRVKIEDDRVLFLGRASGIINVGGNKVSPEMIEAVLNNIEGVSLSRVYGKKSPVAGQIAVSEIVLETGHDRMTVQKALIVACKEALEPYQRPAAYRFVEHIAVSENGKVIRT